jgi:RNA 3'-terminal phosphate cyclase
LRSLVVEYLTAAVKKLLSKERPPTDYSVSELTGRLAYHWADQIRRYEAMGYGGESDKAAADAVADELKREMDEHAAFLTNKGDQRIMFMLDMAMTFASVHRSKVNVAFITHQDHIPTNLVTSIPCTLRIQAAARALTVPVSLSTECELHDNVQEKSRELNEGRTP